MPTGLQRFFAIQTNLFKETGYPLQKYIDFFRSMADSLENDRAENINKEPEEYSNDSSISDSKRR